MDAPHRREVDHESLLAHRLARNVVATASHRHEQIRLPGKLHGVDYIRDTGAANYQGGVFVDRGVPDRASSVIRTVIDTDQVTM